MIDSSKKMTKNKAVCVRIKPGTLNWLRERINDDEPCVPAVIREIIEEERRRQTQNAPVQRKKK